MDMYKYIFVLLEGMYGKQTNIKRSFHLQSGTQNCLKIWLANVTNSNMKYTFSLSLQWEFGINNTDNFQPYNVQVRNV